MHHRALGALALGLVAAAALAIVVSGDAVAVGERVVITPGNESVLEGRTVSMVVEFGVGEQREEVHVTCGDRIDPDLTGGACPVWSTSVRYNPDRADCGVRENQRQCIVDFPQDFPAHEDGADTPSARGEPATRGEWTVAVGPRAQEDSDSFEVHTSTAYTCREEIARLGEQLLVTTSGHRAGDRIEFELVDIERGVTVAQETRRSAGRAIAYDFLWRPGLDYDLGSDERSRLQVRIDSPTKEETETINLRPGLAEPRVFLEPGLRGQATTFQRTESVLFAVTYAFPGRPPGCVQIPFATPILVRPGALQTDRLRADVNTVEATPLGPRKNFTDRTYAEYLPTRGIFLFNYTIPRDAEATHNGSGNPLYEIQVKNTRLEDGNRLREVNTTDYAVRPYRILPEFLLLQDEVERLEKARLEVNLTYADGSAFTANDTNGPIEVTFGPVDGDTRFNLTLTHQQDGRWNTSQKLDFDHHPIAEYVWEVQGTEDRHGRQDERNRLAQTVTDIVDVVGARPVIDFRTFVGNEEVNGTERTRTVHVNLHAEYKNGLPLTEENIDPSLGGIVLRVKKTNEFGRVLGVDSLVMTAADDDGEWVRSFRIGRSQSSAPIGTWELEVVARDDHDPPNENETGFAFDVRPARLDVAPLAQPPTLVDTDTERIEYRIRLTYPDGTLLTDRLVDASRGGDLSVQLERIQGVGQDPAVEQRFDPRSQGGGQSWNVALDSSKMVPGNHFFNVTGEDIHGNLIGPEASRLFTVLFDGEFRNSTTPLCPKGNESTCERERGSDIFAVFPGSDGDTGLESPKPQIRVLRKLPDEATWITHKEDVRISTERFHNLTGQTVEDGHVGFFDTDESTPEGLYRLYIIGRAKDDTGFAGYSDTFQVTPITVDREILDGLPATAQKGQELTATIERKAGDIVDSVRAVSGRVSTRGVQVTPTPLGTFVRWTPAKTTPSGPATVQVEGRDVFGNPFEVDLGPVELQPLEVSVDIADPPDPEAKRGLVMETEVELTFPDGSIFRPVHGTPDVIIRDATGEQIDTGTARFSQDRWDLNWRPPASIETGRYVMETGGRDRAGNTIETVQTDAFTVVPGRIAGDVDRAPGDVARGGQASMRFTFDTQPEQVNATVTTGTEALGEPAVQVDNGTVRLVFQTTRTTPLVQAFFRVSGTDAFGNELTARSPSFQIDPMRLNVRYVRQPSTEIETQSSATARFVIEYPDGSRMRAGQGSPIVGLFIQNNPRGLIEDVQPLEQDPTVWRIRWDPPEDVRRGVPFHFTVSALDRWQNEAPPTPSRGFFVTNPVVPDYLPTPGPGPWIALVSVLAAAGLATLQRDRRFG